MNLDSIVRQELQKRRMKMTEQQRGITMLLRSALFNEQVQLPETFDFLRMLKLGRAHQILPLLYYGVRNSALTVPEEVQAVLRKATLQNAMVDQWQETAGQAIFSAFDQAGLDYMPLKGILRKKDYPRPEMRPMSDLDILIRVDQYDRIGPIMEQLGFQECYESDHELAWKNAGGVVVELHKHIIPSYNRDYYSCFGDGWKLAHLVPGTTCRYEMTAADSLIYELTHMAKHYRDGGIGIRHLTDVWLCAAKGDALNGDYIREELQKLKLWDFYENVLATGNTWYADGPANEKTDFITEYIFASGSYGTMDQKVLANGVRAAQTEDRTFASVRRRKFLRLMFPSYEAMSKRYSAVARFPILLPLFWLVRWIQVLFKKHSAIQNEVGKLKMLTPDQIDQFQSALTYVGLRFDHGE